jgi:hypothetical protein
MKKKAFFAIAASVVIGLSAMSAVAYAKNEKSSPTAEAVVEESNLDGQLIVMRSFFTGYIIDRNDIEAIETAAKDQDNTNRKNLQEILDVLDRGQSYTDSQIGCEYMIIRRPGEEDVTFELPRSTVRVVDLRGYDFTSYTNIYNAIDKDFQPTGETISGTYGSFELYR